MKTNFLPFKKTFVTLLILSIFLGLSNQVKASGIVGGDISYQCTNTAGVYKVTMKTYRDCSGVGFCANCANLGTCTTSSSGWSTGIVGLSPGYIGVNYGSFTLTALTGASGYDIIQTCNSTTTICNNCNTRTAGTFSPGIEVYSYEGEVDLSNIPSACCKLSFQASTCCRSGYIHTVVPGSFFMNAEVNRCQTSCNSAPIFTNSASIAVCSGVDFVYNLGAIDVDGDSLSYAFGAPMSALNTNVTYITPYSSSYLIPFFGAPNVNAGYPAGMRIDPVTGDVVFRPTAVINSYLVIEVTQWKLVAGVWTNVGKTRRDVEFHSLSCGSNKIPILKTYKNGVLQNGIQNFVAYASHQFCIDVVAQDQSLTADPTATDSTDIKWNNPGSVDNTMSNATFTRNYILANRATNGPKADSFKFCWTPPISAVRSLPHLFTVSGSDRNCPIRAVFTRGITIQVQTPKMVINETTKKVFCNNKTTTFNVNYSANGVNLLSNNVFTVQLSDSLGSFTSATTIGTATNTISDGAIVATIPSGLPLNKTYQLRLLSSSNSSVNTEPYDITMVQGFTLPTITSNKDTICSGLNAEIIASATGNITNYKWLLNNQVINNAPNFYLIATLNGTYKVVVSNTGCADTSNAKTLVVNAKPTANFTAPISYCFSPNNTGFNVLNTSTINSGNLSYQWLFSNGNNSTALNPNILLSSAANITIKLIASSTNNCVDTMIKTVLVSQQPSSNFTSNTYSQCRNNNNVFTFVHDSTAGNTCSWDFGDSSFASTAGAIKNYSKAGTYLVKLIEQNPNGCIDSTIKTVQVYPIPMVAFDYFTLREQCLKTNQFSFGNLSTIESGTMTYKWVMGENDTIRQLNATKSFSKKGRYDIYLYCTSDHNCTNFWRNDVTIYDPKIDSIVGNKSPNISSTPYTYSVRNQPSVMFEWTVTNGAIQSGQGTNSVDVIWSSVGTGMLKARINEAYTCFDSTYFPVNITFVGVNDLSLENDLKVFPNPSKSFITITNKNNLIGKKYIITNLVGQTLQSGKLNLDETIVNLETLQSGMYFLSLDGINKQSIKIIKE